MGYQARPAGEQRRRRMLAFIAAYVTAHQVAPDFDAIGRGVGLRSTNAVRNHLLVLVDQGLVAPWPPSAHRSVQLTEAGWAIGRGAA